MNQDRKKKARFLRFVGIVCWFLALFMLLSDRDTDKKQEAEQNAIVSQTETETEDDGKVNTIIMPTND